MGTSFLKKGLLHEFEYTLFTINFGENVFGEINFGGISAFHRIFGEIRWNFSQILLIFR